MNTALKYPGSKWRIAQWIVDHFPPADSYDTYLEPYFGSGAVFFTKEPSWLEVINDIDDQVVNFFHVCRTMPEELARQIMLTPYARTEYEMVQQDAQGQPLHLTGNSMEDARRFAVRCWQSTGSSLDGRSGWKRDVNNRASNSAHTWAGLPERIGPVAERLKQAQIEHEDAIALIEKFNRPNVLIYADPPYLGNLRRSNMYRREMKDIAQHKRLLEALLAHKGPAIISGYESELYNDALRRWEKVSILARAMNNAPRIETIWFNYEPPVYISDFYEADETGRGIEIIEN